MIVNFIYCIDEPAVRENISSVTLVRGWLLCSHPMLKVALYKENHTALFSYGIERPDLPGFFPDCPGNAKGGFVLEDENAGIDMYEKYSLSVHISLGGLIEKQLSVELELVPGKVQYAVVEFNHSEAEKELENTEKRFLKTLQKAPWITLRMDITNKCNLKCIMCHYAQEEISSRPAQLITPAQLRHYIGRMGPYIRHIMLSCGFEPLMSKHFESIVRMIHDDFPHMEIGMCTNGMLMNSKNRKAIIAHGVTHLILSLDGVTKDTVERIRVGADFARIVANINALRDLKRKYRRKFPLMYMDFVLMDSNIHEAPAFVAFCAELDIELIDFRHMVGNIFFQDHPEMLSNHQAKYNYFRERTIEASKKYHVQIRMPEVFDIAETYTPEQPEPDWQDAFRAIEPDTQDAEIPGLQPERIYGGQDVYYDFLSKASCLRPFNEIMIIDQRHIKPCSYYEDIMGTLDGDNTLYDIYFNEKFRQVRLSKLHSAYDPHCRSCPIRAKLLPTEIIQ